MSKGKKTTKAIPDVLAAHIAEREALIEAQGEVYSAVYDAIRAARDVAQAAWVANGGCPRCGGKGYHHLGYDSDYDCGNPEQPCTGRGANEYYAPTETNWGPPESDDLHPWAVAVKFARDSSSRPWSQLGKGRLGIITKGRKYPPGLIGSIVAIIEGAYGDRVGMLVPKHIDPTGIIWVAASNVEVCLGLPSEVRRDYMAQYEANRAAYAARKGLAPKPFYSPEDWATAGGLS